MGYYDLPAAIELILQTTSAPKLFYVGFSQGTSSLMVLLSERPEYNDKFYVASLMAPIGYMDHADYLVKLASSAITPLFQVIRLQKETKSIDIQTSRELTNKFPFRNAFSVNARMGIFSKK